MKDSTSTLTSTMPMKKSSSMPSASVVVWPFFKLLRVAVLQAPLYCTLTLWLLVHGAQIMYTGPLTQLVNSFRLSTDESDEIGLYVARDPEVTYYSRQCHLDDITTHDANDLLIHDHYSLPQRQDVMMKHGAVVMKNILSHNTSSKLRHYLEQRHDTFMKNGLKLPWNEIFWDGGDGSRLSLGIGPEDDPIIAQALQEVGNNRQLEATLTAILGPNPALVEVSTLTTMHGAPNQGIHTDSDYFGSSVLYARTFLHSYTMFVALQHTTAKLGATTLCPGTHFCANADLEYVCMAPNDATKDRQRNSFEASSNGNTGINTGAMRQGDAMMFNQNVWHRGPKNNDPDRPMNRAMFILTFISQRPFEKGDVRQQGWGTYYYMRHSMWGQAFADLKTVLKGGMNLPQRLLKAYGLYTTPSSGNGHAMPWLEHWARQMANDMDFFTADELETFKDMLEEKSSRHGVLKLVRGDPNIKDWNDYLLDMLRKATTVMDGIYLMVLLAYLAVHMVGYSIYVLWMSKPSDSRAEQNNVMFRKVLRETSWFVGNLVLGHIFMIGIFFAAKYFIMHQTPLFRRISDGYIFQKPFPALPPGVQTQDMLQGRITTIPDRMDVLFGSRLDADFLASMNNMLEYHPGNQEWRRMIQETAVGFPLLNIAIEVLVDHVTSNTKPLNGVTRRFLRQDYSTGYWTVMTKDEAHEEAGRSIIMEESPLLKVLAHDWKQVLADARFGRLRETAMSKTWTPKTVDAWMNTILFPRTASQTTNEVLNTLNKQKDTPSLLHIQYMTKLHTIPSKPVSWRVQLHEMTSKLITFKEGDTILVKGSPDKGPYLAKIREILGKDMLRVQPVDSYHRKRMRIDSIQPYRPVQQGDWVLVPPDDNDDEQVSAQVTLVHPLGTVGVRIGGDAVEDDAAIGDAIETINISELYLDESQVPHFRLAPRNRTVRKKTLTKGGPQK